MRVAFRVAIGASCPPAGARGALHTVEPAYTCVNEPHAPSRLHQRWQMRGGACGAILVRVSKVHQGMK